MSRAGQGSSHDSSDGRRVKRVAERVRAYLGEALSRHIDDPRLVSLVVTHVELTDDLSLARIDVRLLGDDSPELRRRALAALRGAASRLRRELGPRLALRRVPELRFVYDTGLDAARRVSEILNEIAEENAGRGDPERSK
jgi:ribosome-binding factor A